MAFIYRYVFDGISLTFVCCLVTNIEDILKSSLLTLLDRTELNTITEVMDPPSYSIVIISFLFGRLIDALPPFNNDTSQIFEFLKQNLYLGIRVDLS